MRRLTRGETCRGHTPYCASEICHFRLMEENISNARDVWVETTLKEALQYDCVGGLCGTLGMQVCESLMHMITAFCRSQM
jgi:hypothetical protein